MISWFVEVQAAVRNNSNLLKALRLFAVIQSRLSRLCKTHSYLVHTIVRGRVPATLFLHSYYCNTEDLSTVLEAREHFCDKYSSFLLLKQCTVSLYCIWNMELRARTTASKTSGRTHSVRWLAACWTAGFPFPTGEDMFSSPPRPDWIWEQPFV